MIKAVKDVWMAWADEAIGRRGFWRSLPWYLLCFGSALGAVNFALAAAAAIIAILSGDVSIFTGSVASIFVIWLLQVLAFSAYNATKQINVPWDKGR